MGRANSLLKNVAINRGQFINKLSAIAIKANTIKANTIKANNKSEKSSLYSLDILEASWDGSVLTFNRKTQSGDNNISLIRFTDRPFRFDKHFVGEEAEPLLDFIFLDNSEGFNSFEKDPPNGVLVLSDDSNSLKGKQEAFEIKMRTVANGKISMILNLLQNQNNISSFENKHITLFIDDFPTTGCFTPTNGGRLSSCSS